MQSKKRYKILVVSSSYPNSSKTGPGFFIHELNKKLLSNFDIVVLAPYQKDDKEVDLIDNIKVYRFKQFPFNLFSLSNNDSGMFESIKKKPFKLFLLFTYIYYQILYINRICKKERIKIIQYHWILPNGFSNYILKNILKSEIPSFMYIRGSDYWGFYNKIVQTLRIKLINKFNLLFSVSEAIKKDINGYKLKTKIEVIPTGIDTKEYNIISKTNKELIEINLLFVGKVCKSKGFDVLLKSLNLLKKNKINFTLKVIAQSIENKFKEYINFNNLEKFINIIGKVQNSDMPKYYNEADIFILPSLSEGWPNVVKEALSCGCICIVSDIPVFKELKGKYKFLNVVKTGDENELAEMIIHINKNFEKFIKYKDQARQFAVENFDINMITEKIVNEYNKLLSDGK